MSMVDNVKLNIFYSSNVSNGTVRLTDDEAVVGTQNV